MAKFTTYTTVAGDRWDTVAHKAYGDESKMSEIIKANKYIPITSVLAPGLVLNIPIIKQSTISSTAVLPPWRGAQ